MKVRLVLGVAPLLVFPVITELEIEVASGTYLKQSQVRIIGVSADDKNRWRTIVDIDLVPLGEKFDNTTALLLYERLWHHKVPLNRSLFGGYATLYIAYPGSSFIFLITFYFIIIICYCMRLMQLVSRYSIITATWISNWEWSPAQ